ncbi:hypothetical protein AVEN_231126-1 [Araneus ventricosus]|uniref:Uncharacterized protein n=1 Tax=Araneus ventricosus TaxID=182803 RepID=A0A4Y2UD66_ARAVE|nr:hypothetical protein AVEN_231126-1 [Araneus ventricosus]
MQQLNADLEKFQHKIYCGSLYSRPGFSTKIQLHGRPEKNLFDRREEILFSASAEDSKLCSVLQEKTIILARSECLIQESQKLLKNSDTP